MLEVAEFEEDYLHSNLVQLKVDIGNVLCSLAFYLHSNLVQLKGTQYVKSTSKF